MLMRLLPLQLKLRSSCYFQVHALHSERTPISFNSRGFCFQPFTIVSLESEMNMKVFSFLSLNGKHRQGCSEALFRWNANKRQCCLSVGTLIGRLRRLRYHLFFISCDNSGWWMAALSLAFLCQDEDGRGMQLLRLARRSSPIYPIMWIMELLTPFSNGFWKRIIDRVTFRFLPRIDNSFLR